jgi:hypothetical protein
MLATCPAHTLWFDLPNTKYGSPYYVILFNILCPSIPLSTLFSNTLNLCSSLNMTDQVSHPKKTTHKIIWYMIETGTSLETSNAQTIHLSKGNCSGTYINIKLPESAFHPAFQTMCIYSERLLSLLVNHFQVVLFQTCNSCGKNVFIWTLFWAFNCNKCHPVISGYEKIYT